MRTSRTVRPPYSSEGAAAGNAKRDSEGRLCVPLYSGFFSGLTENFMCTNAMFDRLLREINTSVFPYPTKENIVLNVYESSREATDIDREAVLIGFGEYVLQLKKKKVLEMKKNVLLFSSIFFLGILMKFLIIGVFPDVLPAWLEDSLHTISEVFVWQLVAYGAFEFGKELKAVRRLKQIGKIKYVFRHWE